MGASPVQIVMKTTQRAARGENEILLATGTPASVNVNRNIETTIYTRRNSIGNEIVDELMTKSEQPTIDIVMPRMKKELMSMKIGFGLNTGALVGQQFAQSLVVPNGLLVDPKAVGVFGNGALADLGEGSYLGPGGRSIPLVRVAAAPAASGEYQVLADGSFLFHAAQAQSLVTATIPYDLADADKISEDVEDIFELWVYFVLQDKAVREVAVWHFSAAQINQQENSEFDFSAEDFPIQLQSLAEDCVPDITFFKQKANC